jgi:hypothetical protein
MYVIKVRLQSRDQQLRYLQSTVTVWSTNIKNGDVCCPNEISGAITSDITMTSSSEGLTSFSLIADNVTGMKRNEARPENDLNNDEFRNKEVY